MSDEVLYLVVKCPLCDYVTGISKWSAYGEQNARGALASHLHRKKHGYNRTAAREAAATAEIAERIFDRTTQRYAEPKPLAGLTENRENIQRNDIPPSAKHRLETEG